MIQYIFFGGMNSEINQRHSLAQVRRQCDRNHWGVRVPGSMNFRVFPVESTSDLTVCHEKSSKHIKNGGNGGFNRNIVYQWEIFW